MPWAPAWTARLTDGARQPAEGGHFRRVAQLLSGVVLAALVAVAPAGAASPLGLDFERDISPNTANDPFPFNRAFDPIVATHPTDPDRIAVLYHRYRSGSGSCSSLATGLRISHDGGVRWHEADGLPWAGTGRPPNWHGTPAWGPGPRAGKARLYWADTTVPCSRAIA